MKWTKLWQLLWRNRTRTFSGIQTLVAAMAAIPDLFSRKGFLILLAVNAFLTWLLGQFNAWQEKNQPPPPPPTENQ